MAKHRTHSTDFKRQVAQKNIAGETLHALTKRHDLSRNLIRIWVAECGDRSIVEGDHVIHFHVGEAHHPAAANPQVDHVECDHREDDE